jgi:DNA-binding CsgD family transcriptional regulator
VGHLEWSRASFRSSLVPMVIANDARQYVAANPAACLLLRMPEEDLLRLRIDDLAPAESRPLLEALWESFLRQGIQEGAFELAPPDGSRLLVDYSATANVEPGLHLSILMFPSSGSVIDVEPQLEPETLLTEREREILGMVAMGRGTSWIAAELGVSASTVETHVRNFLEKLGARNRAHAIALGLQTGEIGLELDPPPPRNWG